MNTSNKHLNLLVHDLIRLGDYSRWMPPKDPENISWFSNKNGKHTDEILLAQRLEELAIRGANLSDFGYAIANINKPKMLEVAFKYGADPNKSGIRLGSRKTNNGLSPIERAIYKKRTKIAETLISHPNFNFRLDTPQGKTNVLFIAVETGNLTLANKIVKIKPELILEQPEIGSNILLSLSIYLSKGKKLNSKVLTFAKNCLDYADNNGFHFSINAANQRGQTILSSSQEIATLITEHIFHSLKNSIDNTNNQTTKTKSIKL
jgi:ankyrin repeat protein